MRKVTRILTATRGISVGILMGKEGKMQSQEERNIVTRGMDFKGSLARTQNSSILHTHQKRDENVDL